MASQIKPGPVAAFYQNGGNVAIGTSLTDVIDTGSIVLPDSADGWLVLCFGIVTYEATAAVTVETQFGLAPFLFGLFPSSTKTTAGAETWTTTLFGMSFVPRSGTPTFSASLQAEANQASVVTAIKNSSISDAATALYTFAFPL